MQQKRAARRCPNNYRANKYPIHEGNQILSHGDKAYMWLGLMFGCTFAVIAFHAIVTGVI